MPQNNIDLLAISRGTVSAPAGCGKTYLIAETLTRHVGAKPILVLTHTNAGVSALRERLRLASVSLKAYRLSTIDGWAMRLIQTFPARSAHDPVLLELRDPRADYPKIREAAAGMLEAGHVNDVLVASYARLIVDEYQDCSVSQHAIIAGAARSLPTCVLGDPMQAIFGFGTNLLADWNEEVITEFPLVGELDTPWRWINANAEPLGHWLLEVREKLRRREQIDLRLAPPAVTWIELDGSKDHQQRLMAARVRPPEGCARILIIGESANTRGRHKLASQTHGATTVETVELEDLILFAQDFDLEGPDALALLSEFAQRVMTNVGARNLVRRVDLLLRGAARKPPTDIEKDAIAFAQAPSHRTALNLLMVMNQQGRVRTYRPTLLWACMNALRLCSGTDQLSFRDASLRIREEYRLLGRPLPRRAVGSTLLLKGLEADVAVVLNADALDAPNLYVAMTRGSHALTICSRFPVLYPAKR